MFLAHRLGKGMVQFHLSFFHPWLLSDEQILPDFLALGRMRIYSTWPLGSPSFPRLIKMHSWSLRCLFNSSGKLSKAPLSASITQGTPPGRIDQGLLPPTSNLQPTDRSFSHCCRLYHLLFLSLGITIASYNVYQQSMP